MGAVDAKGDSGSQGAESCGKWLVNKRLKDGKSWTRITNRFWLAGFISGANVYRRGKASYLEGTDMDSAISISFFISKLPGLRTLRHRGNRGCHRKEASD